MSLTKEIVQENLKIRVIDVELNKPYFIRDNNVVLCSAGRQFRLSFYAGEPMNVEVWLQGSTKSIGRFRVNKNKWNDFEHGYAQATWFTLDSKTQEAKDTGIQEGSVQNGLLRFKVERPWILANNSAHIRFSMPSGMRTGATMGIRDGPSTPNGGRAVYSQTRSGGGTPDWLGTFGQPHVVQQPPRAAQYPIGQPPIGQPPIGQPPIGCPPSRVPFFECGSGNYPQTRGGNEPFGAPIGQGHVGDQAPVSQGSSGMFFDRASPDYKEPTDSNSFVVGQPRYSEVGIAHGHDSTTKYADAEKIDVDRSRTFEFEARMVADVDSLKSKFKPIPHLPPTAAELNK